MSEGPGEGPGGGPSAGQIMSGIFLILVGLCMTLLGGGCTILWLGMTTGSGSNGGVAALLNPLFLVSLVILVAGLYAVWTGVKLLLGRYRA
jgi:hypothetical protein